MQQSKKKKDDTSLHTFFLHHDAVSDMQLVGDTLYSGSYDCSVCKIDLQRGLVVNTFHGNDSPVHCVRESEGMLFVGNEDATITILDTKGVEEMKTLAGHRGAVTAIFPDENTLYTGARDGVIRVWDLRMHKCLKKIKVHTDPITSIHYLNGSIITSSWDGCIYIHKEGEEGKRLSMATPSSAPVLDVQCLAGTMYAGCRDGRARAWLADQDKPICTYIAHNAPIQALLLDEEARMYTGSDDNSIRVWDLKVPKRVVDTESCVYVFEGHTDGVLCLAKGESLLYSGGYDHTIRIWDAKAVDRAVIPGLIECGIPLHRLNAMAESGPVVLGNETAEKASDPDWWKSPKYVLGGRNIHPRIGLRLDEFMLAPTVVEVFADSSAAAAGLQASDVILRLNDFDVPTVDLLFETVAYLKPGEELEMTVQRRLSSRNTTREVSVTLIVEDPDSAANEDGSSLIAVKQVIGGVYDVLDPQTSFEQQAEQLKIVFEAHADFFRKVQLKFGVPNSTWMTLRSFWLLCSKCNLVTPKRTLAELDRLFLLNRVRQLYPHPRVQPIRSPHEHSNKLPMEDLLFGLARLASHKYSKVLEKHLKLERLIHKHLLPFALTERPDVLSEVGLGNLEANLEGHHQRVLLKLFTKFSGSEAPVSACTGDSFILAIKSLQLNAHGGTSDELLRGMVAQVQQLYMASKHEATWEVDYAREMVTDEFLYGLALVGKRVCGAGSLSEVAGEFIERFIVGFVR